MERSPEAPRQPGIPRSADVFERRALDKERDRLAQETARAAFEIHLLRYMTAPEDPYQRELLAGVDPDELRQRDWDMAASIVNQNLPGILEALHERYQTYLKKTRTSGQAA